MRSKKWIALLLLALLLLLFVCVMLRLGGKPGSEEEAAAPKNENALPQTVPSGQPAIADASPAAVVEPAEEEPVLPSTELSSDSSSAASNTPEPSSEVELSPSSTPIPESSISGENILPEMPPE